MCRVWAPVNGPVGATSQLKDLFSLRPFLREQANVVAFPIGPQLDAASLYVCVLAAVLRPATHSRFVSKAEKLGQGGRVGSRLGDRVIWSLKPQNRILVGSWPAWPPTGDAAGPRW